MWGALWSLALAPLPFHMTWWDQREDAFRQLVPENVTCRAGSPATCASQA